MTLTRRTFGRLAAFAAASAVLPAGGLRTAFADADATQAAIMAFTGGATPAEGGVTIGAPEIAENGNTVPIDVSADGASQILILAAGNPSPGVATFSFGAMMASQAATTRIRLAKTQDVVAVAKLADGSFGIARREIKVTIGGCGG